MKTKIEKYIPDSISQIQAFVASKNNKSIPKEFKGYLSSLGASIKMSGLLPTLAVYYSEESKADRKEVIAWVYNIIKSLPEFNSCNNKLNLLKYAIDIQSDLNKTNQLIEEIMNLSVALKLSIRTFPLQ